MDDQPDPQVSAPKVSPSGPSTSASSDADPPSASEAGPPAAESAGPAPIPLSDRSAPPESLGALAEAVRSLTGRFDTHIATNALERKAFDALHAELQTYKQDFLLNELHKPVIRNVLHLYDSFVRLEQSLPAAGGRSDGPSVDEFAEGVGDFVRNMENFRLEITEVLARLDVEPYDDRHDALELARLGTLDRKLHRPVAVAYTEDPALRNKVVRVHKQGFYWRERVFRPAEVTILQHKPGPASDGGEDG